LDKVDRRVGRLHVVIKRCGFEEVLKPVTWRPTLKISQLQGMVQSPSFGLVTQYWSYSPDCYSIDIPGGHIAVILD
jgi:hypothetical protein